MAKLGAVGLVELVLVLALAIFGKVEGAGAPGLQVGFYRGKCRGDVDVEGIVRNVVVQAFRKDPTIVAALLRMQFHDCFVNVRTQILVSFFSFHNLLYMHAFLTQKLMHTNALYTLS